jgi:ElaB/YqjD/DUF883 family membrane-anchored ribosome-binding protein
VNVATQAEDMTMIGSTKHAIHPSAVYSSEGGTSPAVIMENKAGAFTSKQMSQAANELNRREYLAFGHLAGDATPAGIVKLSKAYLAYYEKLTPEEKQCTCYKGSDTDVRRLLNQAEAALQGKKSDATPGSQELKDTLSILLDAYRDRMLSQAGKEAAGRKTGTGDPDEVTLSEEALLYSFRGEEEPNRHSNALAKRYAT